MHRHTCIQAASTRAWKNEPAPWNHAEHAATSGNGKPGMAQRRWVCGGSVSQQGGVCFLEEGAVLGAVLLPSVTASAMADPPVCEPYNLAELTTSSFCIALALLATSHDLIC